jgi:Tfp pilus assembly protein PilO
VKGSDKAIVLGVVMAVVLAGFYLKVLSPKREKAADLKTEITKLQPQVDEQTQLIAFGEQARQEFPTFYSRMVVLGKAVPDQADTASLMVQISAIADRTGVKFDGIEVASGSGGASSGPSTTTGTSSSTPTGTPSSTPPASTTSSGSSAASTTASTSGSGSTASSTSVAPTTTAAAPATEAGAANLPIGATVGSAGLPILPYDLTFTGSYFQVADFLKGVDDLVRMRGSGQLDPNGRLLTIDGFALEPVVAGSNPQLEVSLAVTSYVTPATEGLTVGATPGGPAPAPTDPQAQPASATVAR